MGYHGNKGLYGLGPWSGLTLKPSLCLVAQLMFGPGPGSGFAQIIRSKVI
jgi:hypothetical protein